MDGFAVRAADIAGIAAGRLPGRRRAARRRGRSSRARRWGSRRAARFPTAPTPSSRSSLLSKLTTASRFRSRSTPGPTSGPSAATCARAMRCSRPGRASARRRSARSPRPGVAEVSCVAAPDGRGAEHGHRAAASGRAARAGADLRVELGRCSPPRSRPPAPSSSGSTPVADDEDAHRRGARAGPARPTCSSAPAASPSGRTTSSAACSRELGVEEVFWGVAVKPGKPLAFGVREPDARLRAARATRSRRSSSVELFVRPALAALQGARAGPALRAGAARRSAAPERRARRARPRAARAARTTRRSSSRSPARSRT